MHHGFMLHPEDPEGGEAGPGIRRIPPFWPFGEGSKRLRRSRWHLGERGEEERRRGGECDERLKSDLKS